MSNKMKLIFLSQRERIHGNPYDYLERLLSGQPDAFIIREKDLSDDALLKFAEPIVKIAEKYHVSLFLRGSVDNAEKLGITNLQLSFQEFKHIAIPTSINQVGVSIHHIDEAKSLETANVSHLLYGHIFTSPCKPGLPPRGLALLREMGNNISIPVFAIGGITPNTLPLLMPVNVSGACFMSSAMTQNKPETFTQHLRTIIEQHT